MNARTRGCRATASMRCSVSIETPCALSSGISHLRRFTRMLVPPRLPPNQREPMGDFWTMHEYLFEHQHALKDADLHQYEIDLRLEPVRFDRVRTSQAVAWPIDHDRA